MTRLLYLEDPCLSSFRARIDHIEGDWIELDQTAFYPGGGGQDADCGWIDDLEVAEVRKREGIEHLVPGHRFSEGEEIEARIDWERRLELMRGHTAEHMLSAVMQRDFGSGRSVETHLGSKKSKCDYKVDRPLDEGDLRQIEGAVNAEIEKDLSVTSFVVTRDEAEDRYDMGKVPAGADTIRIVKIGELDATPCIGGHVDHTRQIGRFSISSWEMKEGQVVRIRYRLAPRRAI